VISQRDNYIPPQLQEIADETDFDGGERLVFYVAPVSVVRDRLELMGYTLATCKAVFNDCVHVELSRCERSVATASDRMIDYYGKIISSLRSMDADAWIETLKVIISKQLISKHDKSNPDGTVLGYMLENDWFGYDGPDRNVGIRLAIEACLEGAQLMYDISDLVAQGFIDADDDLVEAATTVHAGQYLSVGRTIILTEGRSDSSALSASLLLLYPHLADYYSFLDFDAFRVPGGSGSLANLTRAMAAAGVINRIIALFDNDTAGESAMRGLRSLNLPTNICLARLPDLEDLRAYPTLGPTGSTTMDVNGIAASIELYLGRDALTASDGKLVPVQCVALHVNLDKTTELRKETFTA